MPPSRGWPAERIPACRVPSCHVPSIRGGPLLSPPLDERPQPTRHPRGADSVPEIGTIPSRGKGPRFSRRVWPHTGKSAAVVGPHIIDQTGILVVERAGTRLEGDKSLPDGP